MAVETEPRVADNGPVTVETALDRLIKQLIESSGDLSGFMQRVLNDLKDQQVAAQRASVPEPTAEEREAISRFVGAVVRRSYVDAKAKAKPDGDEMATRADPVLLTILIGIGASIVGAAAWDGMKIGGKVVGGAAGWLAGGGSMDDIPWGDIVVESTK